MAQLAEQLICNQQVNGSSPFIGFYNKYGWVPEWPKGADCKSVGDAFEGSNPSPSTFNLISRGGAVWKLVGLITRRSLVQILSPLLKADALYAQLAQLVEQWTENPRVSGSIPELGTIGNSSGFPIFLYHFYVEYSYS